MRIHAHIRVSNQFSAAPPCFREQTAVAFCRVFRPFFHPAPYLWQRYEMAGSILNVETWERAFEV